jgi:16S rRNA (cytidine1402-2'-O)-methyltransferase
MTPTSLYLIPTPIGNLEDITLRALRIMKEVDTLLAEDTRKSGILLKHYGIAKPLRSYHAFNEHRTLLNLVEKMGQGETFALLSDAGTPAISDPGYLLVRECLLKGITIECLPGATAFVPALVKSGFPTDRFIFEGFLPHKKGRMKRLELLTNEERSVIFYESPHRLIKLLEQSIETFGTERRVSVSRELTKIYEETITGTLAEVLQHYAQKPPKGEIVVILEGQKPSKED